MKFALTRRWSKASPADIQVAHETTFRLSDDTCLERDYVRYPREISWSGMQGPNVLLVVEVSESSLGYDLGRKADLYASFGLRELWLSDVVKTSAHVIRDPTPRGYAERREFGATEMLIAAFAPQVFALRRDELDLF